MYRAAAHWGRTFPTTPKHQNTETPQHETIVYQNIPGTFDVLPAGTEGAKMPPSPTWRHVERTVRGVMQRYGFEEIRTPIFEPTELVARGVGQATDIVQKEMFAFERSDTQYVLRPEVTAPVMRAYLQHHLGQRGGVQKLFYVGPCFRAERPQKGRFRQFHQFGSETIGAADARADAETVALMTDVYRAFGISDARLRLNSLGSPSDRERYRAALVDYFAPYEDDLSDTSRRRLKDNPLRLLDTKIEHERRLLEDAPRLLDFIDEESQAHYDAVKGWLDDLGMPFEEDPLLVRGLDYYTRTAFELESDALGAQSALAGGGRYDLLAEELGAERTVPAVGFAAGFERLFLALEAAGYDAPVAPAPDVFLAAIGEEAEAFVFKKARRLRGEGLAVESDLMGRSLKAQMREANRSGAPYAVVIGGRELEAGRVDAKHMPTGEETEVALDGLTAFLFEQRAGGQPAEAEAAQDT
jgi:histidyl-tRNA synthetase